MSIEFSDSSLNLRYKRLLVIAQDMMSTLDLNTLLNKITAASSELTNAQAASILLFDPIQQELFFRASTHLKAPLLDDLRVPLDGSIAGDIIKSGKPMVIQDAQSDVRHHKGTGITSAFITENLLAVPMFVKGQTMGVLEALNKIDGEFAESDQELLLALGAQAAVALENAQLFDALQKSYESILEGWAKALELRDYETQGHTLRVTELTLRIAREMGLKGNDLVIIRRGAILHDIGKIAIPDQILLKPGKLTSEEREIMTRHPTYAKEMIEKIVFLHPVIDIPYYHHEQWDGSGYPKGLKGEEIPLNARIFAIADFWDALTTNRPYRKALPGEEVKAMIAERSSTHFDPDIVEVFLKLMNSSEVV